MQSSNESAVKFRDLMYLFVSKLWVMILAFVVVSVSIFGYNYFTYEPMYKSTGSIYILRQDGELEKSADYNSNFSLALSVVSDCTKLLTSRSVLNQVIEDNNLEYSYGELCSMITIQNPSNTRYLEISAVADEPEKAKVVVDSICQIGKEQIVSVMGFDQVNIVDEGTLPTAPFNGIFSYTVVIGALVAFLLTYIVFALAFIFDDRISDPDTLEKQLGLSVLAMIPNMNKEKEVKSSSYYKRPTTTRHKYFGKY